jgi:hypothetical protein
MKTKEIPIIIMLIGGCVVCVTSLLKGTSMHNMLIALVITLICFYILGHVIRVVVEKNFADIINPKETKAAEAIEQNESGMEAPETEAETDMAAQTTEQETKSEEIA